MRRFLAWTLVVPLALLGSQVAHAVAYLLAEPHADARAALLASTGHGYLSYAHFGAALITVLCAVGVLAQARLAFRGFESAGFDARPLAAVPIAVFALQEHFERLAHEGSLSFSVALEPTFLIGLGLQLPFALLAYGLARLLIRAAAVVGQLLWQVRRRTRARRSTPGRRPPAQVLLPRLGALALGHAGRGPPVAA